MLELGFYRPVYATFAAILFVFLVVCQRIGKRGSEAGRDS